MVQAERTASIFRTCLSPHSREDNKFDKNAILLITENKKKLGYVPEKDNIIFARLMDAGKLLVAKIKKIQKKGTFTQISIGIYLVDF